MKTLEEIKEHLSEVGYNRQAMMQIEAFALGGGLITPNYEFDFIKGKGDFEDFMEWFTTEEWEYEKGAYIHVEDGMDVLALSNVYDGKFVGTNGNNIHQYEITEETRPCLDVEIEKIDTKLYENGVMYCPYCDELEPFHGIEASNLEDAKKALDELYNDACNVLGGNNSDKIDNLEVKCHEAIENLVANLHSKEIDKREYDIIVESLKALADLGELYE